MTITAGTRIGPYEIVAAIGAGGPPSLAASAAWRAPARLAVAQARIWS